MFSYELLVLYSERPVLDRGIRKILFVLAIFIIETCNCSVVLHKNH